MNKQELLKLLDSMTLEEKIGQLCQRDVNDFIETTAALTGPKLAGSKDGQALRVLGSVLNFNNCEEVLKVQDMHLSLDRHKIPMLFMMDVIHGYRTIYPVPLAMAGSFDPALMEECCRMAARESVAGGVHLTFAPMVDISRDPRWGRVMESGGEDVLLSRDMGVAQVRAFQGEGYDDPETMATCVKHFAAYGSGEGGRDYNTVELSEHVLRETYLPAYKACLDAGSPMIMPSFNVLNGVPSVANRWLMNKLLREEWGFDGIVISDYNALGELLNHGVAEDVKDCARKGMAAQCDMDMCSMSYYRALKELVEDGEVAEAEVDRAVMRLLELKNALGLFEDPYRGASPEKEAAVCLTPEHRLLARRAAEECAVLLKNEGVLPLRRDVKRIALIGPFAESRELIGSWACHGDTADVTSLKEALVALLPDAEISVATGCSMTLGDTDTSGIAAAAALAAKADVVILCLGESQEDSGEGKSRASISLPGMQMELARQVTAANPSTAAVLFAGRPLDLYELDQLTGAILYMWHPGTEGGNAAARLLLGDANPCGKVSMSFPKALGQCPLYYSRLNTGRPRSVGENERQTYASTYIDCGNLALYPFGHGLSYTQFDYRSLTLDRDAIAPGEALTATVTVKNTGDRAGKETVQLYMRDMVGSTARPVQQLIAYRKIALAPGEEAAVTFTVDETMLRMMDDTMACVSEPGEFRLYTGCADHLLHEQRFTLKK